MRTLAFITFFFLASRAFAQESTPLAPTRVVITQQLNVRLQNAVVSNAIAINWTTSQPTISIFVESVDTGRDIQTLTLSGERKGAFWIFRVPVQEGVSSSFIEIILGPARQAFAVIIDETGQRQMVQIDQVEEVYFPFDATGEGYCVHLGEPLFCMGSSCPPL